MYRRNKQKNKMWQVLFNVISSNRNGVFQFVPPKIGQ